MIVLDASVVIAFFDAMDAHHAGARAFLRDHVQRSLLISPVTKAESLVNPMRAGRIDEASAMLDALGVEEVPLGSDAAVWLARLRIQSGSKLPDCCVLLAAQQRGASIATFDNRLRSSAEMLGIPLAIPASDAS